MKKYTINEAVLKAKKIIGEKKLCTNYISQRDRNELITLKEVNDIVNNLVEDTNFYDESCW